MTAETNIDSPKTEDMNFQEAMQAFDGGASMTRSCWGENEYVFCKKENGNLILTKTKGGYPKKYVATKVDKEATDWKYYKKAPLKTADISKIIAAINESEKPANVPAQTKPHYWLYKQGKDVWNRWAREAFTDENGEDDGRIDKYIEDARNKLKNSDDFFLKFTHKYLIENLEEFKALNPLSVQERFSVYNKMKLDYDKWVNLNSENWNFQKVSSIKLPNIEDKIDFSYTEWKEAAEFYGFVFPVEANFTSSNFFGLADFRLVTFCQAAIFLSTTFFLDLIDFSQVTFIGQADFEKSSFKKDVFFVGSNFYSTGSFISANFLCGGCFSNTTFSNTDFSYTNFYKSLAFHSASFKHTYLHKTFFEGNAYFANAKFESVPQLLGIKTEGVIDLINAHWPDPRISDDPHSDALNYSQIKRRMQELHLHDHEIFFFRKELLCKAEASKRKSEALRKPLRDCPRI